MHYIYNIRIHTLILCFSLLLFLTAACGGEEPTPAPPKEPTGSDLVAKMKEAVKATDSAHFTVDFQIASVEGPVKGTVEIWGERPGKIRAEVSSESPSVDGIVVVSDGERGWAYNPREKLVLVSDQNQYKAQLREQPELREILDTGEKMLDRGFDNTEANNLGTEQINGQDAYKVEVAYGSDDEIDLSGVTAIFWIDQQTYLPHRIEINIERDDFTASGFVVLQGDIETGQPIEADRFSFTAPEGSTVFDLSELPEELPAFSELPKIQ